MSETAIKDSTTPLMKQYEELKARHPGEILLFRLGDFYEIFAEDAKAAAPILEVVLTQRQGVPMCGVPHHAMARYIAKLLKMNFRVAIAEQMEDPETAKGIVKREIIRVISPGTILEENLLSANSNNFLAAVSASEDRRCGLAALDISTGQFTATEMDDTPRFANLAAEISRLNPAEILLPKKELKGLALDGVPVQIMDSDESGETDLESIFNEPEDLAGLEQIRHHPMALEAVKMILAYVRGK